MDRPSSPEGRSEPKEIAGDFGKSLSWAYTFIRRRLPHIDVSTGAKPTYAVPRDAYEKFLADSIVMPKPAGAAAARGLPNGVRRIV